MSNSSATPPRKLSAKRSSADFFSREPSRPRRFSTEMLKTLWIRWERRGGSSGQVKRSSALHQNAATPPASENFSGGAPAARAALVRGLPCARKPPASKPLLGRFELDFEELLGSFQGVVLAVGLPALGDHLHEDDAFGNRRQDGLAVLVGLDPPLHPP